MAELQYGGKCGTALADVGVEGLKLTPLFSALWDISPEP